MTIRGTRAEWDEWTKMKFPQSGQYIIPGALNPIEMDMQKDEGVYVEPNVGCYILSSELEIHKPARLMMGR